MTATLESTETDTDDLARFLAAFPEGPRGLGYEIPGRGFAANVLPLSDVPAAVDSLTGASVWLSVAEVADNGGRGLKTDVRRMLALPNDFDVKPGAFARTEDAIRAVWALSIALGSLPFALVNTGHGVQAWWLLDTDDDAWACDSADDPRWLEMRVLVECRWPRLVRRVCAEFGADMDNVFDMSRIMRLPGTVNMKDPANPVPVTMLGWFDSTPLSVTALSDALDDAGAPEYPGDRDVLGDVVAAHGDWTWAGTTCPYGKAVIAGLGTDTPGTSGRHPWLVGKATRIAAMHRYGCLTEESHGQAVDDLAARFTAVCADADVAVPRAVKPGEVTEAITFGVDKVERWTDAQVTAEFTPKGGEPHQHVDASVEAWLVETVTSPDGQPVSREDAVFGATQRLEYIRQLARAQMVSPWSLLGSSVAYVVAQVPPFLKVPAFVGSPASLNCYFANVGPSGSGKTVGVDVAREIIPALDLTLRNPSSGEGIITLFVDVEKGEQYQHTQMVLSVVDEIATLGAQQDRSGSTLASILRSAWSGSALSTNGADRSRRRHLAAHSYRFVMVMGVQPSTAHVLLDDQGAGTPQRIIWLPAVDRAAPEADVPRPDGNPFADWKRPVTGREVAYPDHVRDLVRQARRDVLRGTATEMDGHALLARLKLAAGLAILHGTTTVDDLLWDISGHVMAVSDRTRQSLLDYRTDEATRIAESRGRSEAVREDAKADHAVERGALVIARYVHRNPDGVTRRQVKDACGRWKPLYAEAVDVALSRGYIEAVPVAGTAQPGHHYRPGQVKP